MIRFDKTADMLIHFEAVKLARACRNIIQACLREEEFADADRAFYEIIREGIERISAGKR